MQALLEDLKNFLSPYLLAVAVLGGSALVGLSLRFVLLRWVKIQQRTANMEFIKAVIRRLHPPSRYLFPFIALAIAEPFLVEISGRDSTILHHFATMGLIGSAAWFLINGAYLLEDYLILRYMGNAPENVFRQRRIRTQLQYIKRIIIMAILLLAFSFALLSFESMRRLGTGLLTSAGVAGIIVGIAAQRTLANLLAGFQIAFTQPIRLDDVVIVENEWGKIEEITLTYVVVRIWDERALVLPITYFTQTPFQNWTRNSTRILGTIFLYADYRMPIDPLRQELRRILNASNFWDGRIQNVLVTNLKEYTMEIRALVSAQSADDAWNLRCEVREKLITFVQENYPDYLPQFRANMVPGDKQDEPLTAKA